MWSSALLRRRDSAAVLAARCCSVMSHAAQAVPMQVPAASSRRVVDSAMQAGVPRAVRNQVGRRSSVAGPNGSGPDGSASRVRAGWPTRMSAGQPSITPGATNVMRPAASTSNRISAASVAKRRQRCRLSTSTVGSGSPAGSWPSASALGKRAASIGVLAHWEATILRWRG